MPHKKKKNNLVSYIRGAQITFHNIRMLTQVNKNIFSWVILMVIAFVLLLTWVFTPMLEFHAVIAYLKANWLHSLAKSDTHLVTVKTIEGVHQFSVGTILKTEYFNQAPKALFNNMLTALYITLGATAAAVIAGIYFIRKKGDEYVDDRHIRGATIVDNKSLTVALKKAHEDSKMIRFSGVPIVRNSEVQHFALHGTTGTGKTVTIMELLDQIRHPKHRSEQDKRAIIFDDSGAFVKKYYDPKRGDIILNPFDARCAKWDLWFECQTLPEFENFAAALIPDDGDKDQFWIKSARNWVANIGYKLGQRGEGTIENLLKAAFNLDLNTLQGLLKNTPAEQLVDKSIAKTAMTIRAVITNFLRSLRYMQGIDENQPKFSFKDWVLNEQKNHGAWVFITSTDEHHEVIKPLISLWLGMATSRVKSLSRDLDRRIFVILDEVPRLQKLLSLMSTLAVGRNYGLCCVLGMQNTAQMRSIYGKDESDAIMDLLSTQLFYRSTKATIADEASFELGEVDIKESTESYSYGYEQTRDGVQTSRQNVTRRVISYSEIQNLNRLEAYLKLPGDFPRTKLMFKHKARHDMAEDFIERQIKLDAQIEQLVSQAENELSPDAIDQQVIDQLLSGQNMSNHRSATNQIASTTDNDDEQSLEYSSKVSTDPILTDDGKKHHKSHGRQESEKNQKLLDEETKQNTELSQKSYHHDDEDFIKM